MQAMLLVRGSQAAAAAVVPSLLAASLARQSLPALLAGTGSPCDVRRRLAFSPWHGFSSHSHEKGAASNQLNGSPSSAVPAGADPVADSTQLHVTVEPLSGIHEGVSVISLSRPAARNAIGRQLLRELAEALDTVRQERTTRCVLVRSVVAGESCTSREACVLIPYTFHVKAL
jgi:methylglutaconyl-CoA hydratase